MVLRTTCFCRRTPSSWTAWLRIAKSTPSQSGLTPQDVSAFFGEITSLTALSDLRSDWVRFVALPNPKLAPYGVAAQQALEHAGLWQFVRKKVVYGENVRQTLQLFESGNADAVLTSDSLLIGKNPDLVPAPWHQPIIQKAGIVSASRNQTAAREFVSYLTSPAGQAIFARFGFGPAVQKTPKLNVPAAQ